MQHPRRELSIAWDNLSANVAGTADLFLLPETTLADDPVLDPVTIPGDTLAGAVFNFGTLVGQNDTVTIEKDLLFSLDPSNPCLDFGCESGVIQVAVSYLPAVLPLPPAVALFLAGLAGLSFLGLRRKTV